METSILISTKQILGLADNYLEFDLDIITHINSAFSVLHQLGVGPEEGFWIEDAEAEWSTYDVPPYQLQMVKTYIYLKVRSVFDPPNTSFLIESTNQQIKQLEWRLNVNRENDMEEVET